MSQNLELNAGDDFIFLLDVSASMGTKDTPTGASRYEYAKEKALAFAHEASKIDTDGISIYRFGEKVTKFSDITPDKIDGVFAAGPTEMSTVTAEAIQEAFQEHIDRKNEQTFVLIVTDGVPADPQKLRDVIVNITNSIKDEHEFAIQFLQVGQDASATKFLAELDDNLKGAKHDIVDAKRLEDVTFMQAVAGALHD